MYESARLHAWFEEERRDFPWRRDRTPYRVWISEVMLQQTRANVVVPYFERWMTLFPNVKALYMAPLESVIKAWEGLGYYSRARHLHAAAKQIVEDFGGEIPGREEELAKIKGFGPYTRGAILSFAFRRKAAAVDGNVVRVVTRLFALEEEVSKLPVKKKIENLTLGLLDEKEPWVTAEALIELGAMVCTPRPRCEICPLKSSCRGYREEKALYLPIKREDAAQILLWRWVGVYVCKNKVLLKKGRKGKVMADLYEFPYEERSAPVKREKGRKLKEQIHTFTKYKAHLYPFLVEVEEFFSLEGGEWVQIEQMRQLPFSSGHRKIAKEVEEL